MNNSLITISTIGMNKATWLEHRRHSIGGSDAAAIVGLNDYASPYSVWAEKTGRLPEKEDNEAMRQGRDFEEYVASRFTEATGKKVRRNNHIIQCTEYPYAHANVDRIIVGEDAGLECKTTSVMNLKKFKNGSYPESYYVQCVHYMAVTGAQKWYLAVLVLNTEFMWFEIERDEDEIKALMEAEAEFWKYVEADRPPMVDGNEATTEAIKTIYSAGTPGTSIDLFGLETTCDGIEVVKRQIKELEALKDEHENRIKVLMAENEKGRCGLYSISWTSSQRSTLDKKALKAAYPSIDFSKFETITNTRTFRISKKEEKN